MYVVTRTVALDGWRDVKVFRLDTIKEVKDLIFKEYSYRFDDLIEDYGYPHQWKEYYQSQGIEWKEGDDVPIDPDDDNEKSRLFKNWLRGNLKKEILERIDQEVVIGDDGKCIYDREKVDGIDYTSLFVIVRS
jgi:hypothetical protein